MDNVINNFDLIKDILKFHNLDEFYYVQVIQRPKDGNSVKGSNTNRLIKYYVITSTKQFLESAQEIIDLCNMFNARAYIHLSKRSFKEVSKIYLSTITQSFISENYRSIGKEYSSACGKSVKKEHKTYLIDLDELYPPETMDKIYNFLNEECAPKGINKIKHIIPTRQGIHLICTPFNALHFQQWVIIEKLNSSVHTNNPTLLYFNYKNT